MQNILLIWLCIGILVDSCLVMFALSRPDRKRSAAFSVLCFLLLIYTLGYIVEIQAQTQVAVWSALVVENFAIPLIPWAFLFTTICLFVPTKFHRGEAIAAFFYGITIFLVVLTNERHMLYYTSIEVVYNGFWYFLKLGKGPVYLLNQLVAVSCMFYSYSIAFRRFLQGSRKLRRQMLSFLLGSIVVFLANLSNVFGLVPLGIDATPLALMVALVCFSFTLIRDDLMDVVVRGRDTAVENMKEAFVVLDNDGDFLYCNKSAIEIFPDLQYFEGTESIYSLKEWPQELMGLTHDQQITFAKPEIGRQRYFQASVQKIYNWSKTSIGMSITIHDVTREVYNVKRLEELADTDPLTRALNRRRFLELVELQLADNRSDDQHLGLILFDIDHFKQINDTYGHQLGDAVLKQIVQVIQNSLRQHDLLCRFGGEEFLAFVVMKNKNDAAILADRLRKMIAEIQIPYEDTAICVTASFGVYELMAGDSLEQAISCVDKAMYQAKHRGRNCVVSYSDETGIAEN